MLYYVRIDASKGIDPANSSNRKECMIYHYWFFNHGFKFQDSVYNGSHDLISHVVSYISDITKNVD